MLSRSRFQRARQMSRIVAQHAQIMRRAAKTAQHGQQHEAIGIINLGAAALRSRRRQFVTG
jgi:hypothetical protein